MYGLHRTHLCKNVVFVQSVFWDKLGTEYKYKNEPRLTLRLKVHTKNTKRNSPPPKDRELRILGSEQ
jgi:hypothetical protein